MKQEVKERRRDRREFVLYALSSADTLLIIEYNIPLYQYCIELLFYLFVVGDVAIFGSRFTKTLVAYSTLQCAAQQTV